MLAANPHNAARDHGRRARRESVYRTRMLGALALSILGVTLVLHAPINSNGVRVGWNPPAVSESIEFNANRTLQAVRGEGGIKASIGLPSPDLAVVTVKETEGDEHRDEPAHSVINPMQARETVYEIVESPPAIRGGLGAYYINIEYPPEAIARQIEGRLVLRFVVGTDGRPRDILVLQSLHALCDSAAVQALRRTTFVPGRQHGKKVPVRMQLPVRFRLVEPGQSSRG